MALTSASPVPLASSTSDLAQLLLGFSRGPSTPPPPELNTPVKKEKENKKHSIHSLTVDTLSSLSADPTNFSASDLTSPFSAIKEESSYTEEYIPSLLSPIPTPTKPNFTSLVSSLHHQGEISPRATAVSPMNSKLPGRKGRNNSPNYGGEKEDIERQIMR